MGPIGLPELLIVFIIVILLFGAKKIPELAKGLGKGIREFKKANSGEDDDDDKKKLETEKKGASKPGSDQSSTSNPESK